MIPKEKIEEVRDRASIVDVISEYIPLTKRGINYVGLCPFHSEKTPSFTVNSEKRIFYCFGCNASGNAITFVMKKDGLAFPDAVRSIAQKYGIKIEESRSGQGPDPREALYASLKAAAEFFMRELKSTEGRGALAYLKKRGYEGEIVQGFSIGYAPNGWDALINHLKKSNIPLDAAFSSGLIVKKERGGFYDRFRGRLMFPILDGRKRVVGFGGRALAETQQPKYLNSPESTVFKKGEILYGLPQAKEAISKEGFAIVVEGYFDLIALHKNGFKNSIATMGTALTPMHIRALKPYAPSIYSLFDSDQAGKAAAVRALSLFLEEDVPCRAVILKKGKDPDEFLATEGPGAMREAISSAEPLMEFFLKELSKKEDLKTPEGKKKFFDTAVPYLKKVKNVAERGHYVSFLAKMLGLKDSLVYGAIEGSPEHAKKAEMPASQAPVKPFPLGEMTVLKILMKHPEMYNNEVASAVEGFSDPVLRAAGAAVLAFCREGRPIDVSAVFEGLQDGVAKSSLAALIFKEDEGFIESPLKMLEDCLKRLKKGRFKDSTREMLKRLDDAGRADLSTEIIKRIETRSTSKK